MSTVMEPKKFASFMKEDGLSLFGSRPQSPALSGRFGLRRSSYSSRSSMSSDRLDTPTMSCVTRATSKEDCATQRFIVWAAVRRNACDRMTEGERLECPLLRCTQRFQDHESMLRHLITCDRLEYCEYWCYEHMRIERFDDSRCKKCLGHPSKRRKMLSMAKSFFTSLGHNKGKAVVDQGGLDAGLSPAPSFASASMPCSSVSPISPDSLDFSSGYLSRSGSNGSSSSSSARFSGTSRSNSNRSSDSRSNSYGRPGGADASSCSSSSASPFSGTGFQPPPRYEDINTRMHAGVHAELPSTEIVEIDSRELTEMPKQSPFPSAAGTRPSAVNMTTQPDFVPDITLSTPALQAIPSIAPTVSPTPPPACPTPPVAMSAVSPIAGQASIDPMNLFLPSELDSTTISQTNFMDWEPVASSSNGMTMPGALDGVDVQSFMDVQSSDATLYTSSSEAILERPSLLLDMQAGLQMAPPPLPPTRPQRPTSTTPAPRSKNLSPSSSVRSTTSTTSTTSTASMGSLMSDVSDASFMSNATSIVSPVSDCSHGAATNPWSTSTSTGDLTTSASPADEFSSFFETDFFATAESGLSTDLSKAFESCYVPDMAGDFTDVFDSLANDALLFPLDTAIMGSIEEQKRPMPLPLPPPAPGTGTSAIPVKDDVADNRTNTATHNDADPLFLDAQDMAASAQDLLLTHVMTSLAKLRDIDCSKNTLALLFQNASPRLIMDTGIQALQTAIATGSETMTPFNTLCFLHLIYAFSLVTYESEAALRSSALFNQSLEYSRHFSAVDRENYLEIVSLIWQPVEMTAAVLSERIRRFRKHAANRAVSSLSLDGAVANAARAFLDDLEISTVFVPLSTASDLIKASPIYSLHFGPYRNNNIRNSPALSSHARTVIDSLRRNFPHVAGLNTRLDAIARLLDDGHASQNAGHTSNGLVDSVRWFEIKLLHAGKASLGTSVLFFDQFVRQTRSLCDPMYAAHDTPLRPMYHVASIALLRTIFDTSKNVHLSQGMKVVSSVLDDSLLSDNLLSSVVTDTTTGKELAAHVLPPTDETADLSQADLLSMDETLMPAAVDDESAAAAAPEGDAAPAEDSDAATKAAKVEVEADDCCELCGYRPKGDPKWFRGSMAKHRLTKHSAEVIYKCPFPNCTSQYRNRPDNLRQHQLEKNHFVEGDEVVAKKPRKHNRPAASAQAGKNGDASTRPAKKRKASN
ncbi:hypothetical protein HMPREF1624_03220 [Sporothrix schenckii ATCC 58251]|uniref:Uncharacterized protein n=1 Tax=Sporothrix schenckii (strain ATCC 58251 / de Perez 2211183) TaxID=1391915 RepID=U7PZE3_SPOS1|nr:hypothetical protein HMPREF1624_03220 [Sporothrix schenckii ATCC 58251]